MRLNLLTRVSVSLFHSWGHRLYANVHFNSNLFGWRMRRRPQIWSIRTHLKEFLLLFDCLEPEINTPRKNFAEKKSINTVSFCCIFTCCCVFLTFIIQNVISNVLQLIWDLMGEKLKIQSARDKTTNIIRQSKKVPEEEEEEKTGLWAVNNP